MMLGAAPGQVRLGPLWVKWRWPVPERGPLLGRCWSYALRPDLSRERFGGLVLRLGARHGLAVLYRRRSLPWVTTTPRAWDRRAPRARQEFP